MLPSGNIPSASQRKPESKTNEQNDRSHPLSSDSLQGHSDVGIGINVQGAEDQHMIL